MSLDIQFYTMGLMLAGGVMMGVVFDTYKIAGVQFRFSRWTIALLDLVYWMAACLAIFRLLYLSNSGEVRLYVFVGLMIGVWLYYLWLSRLTARFVLFAIRIMRAVARIISQLWGGLIVRPLRWLYKGLMLLLGFLGTTAIFLVKVVVQCLYVIRKPGLWLSEVVGITAVWNRLARWLAERRDRRK